MKLAELSTRSGCTAGTIKYYLREGLLPPGTLRHAKQAEYDDRHLARLNMIRVLRDLGELSIADIHRVVTALDDATLPLPQKLGSAYYALPPHPSDPDSLSEERRAEVVEYAVANGWQVRPEAPSISLLAEVLAGVRALWGPVGLEIFDRYALAFDALARGDVEVLDEVHDPADAVRQVVVGTVLWDRAMIALRRLAADHYSTQRFSEDITPPE
jgi:DNA-binding transcriptional MerR regulator